MKPEQMPLGLEPAEPADDPIPLDPKLVAEVAEWRARHPWRGSDWAAKNHRSDDRR
jgi:hypothetical protein